MSVKAVFTPAPAPEGVVTITLSESEARRFTGYAPNYYGSGASYEYAKVRDALWSAITAALSKS